jgi:hypothetical protein
MSDGVMLAQGDPQDSQPVADEMPSPLGHPPGVCAANFYCRN